VPFSPELDGPVTSLATLGGDLIVGGLFTNAGSLPTAHIASWDGSSWSALGSGTDGPVYALAVQSNILLFVGGNFTQAGGQTSPSVARYVGGTWSALGQGVQGTVYALAIYNSSPVAGGDFDLGGVNIYEQNLARLVNNEWRPIALGIDGTVRALAVFNGTLVAGGDFLHADFTTPARHVASFISDTWNAMGVGIGSLDSTDATTVRALHAIGDDALIAGGTFELADLQSTPRIATWDGNGWSALGTGMSGPVNAITDQGGCTIAGGEFARAGTSPTRNVARYCSQTDPDWLPLYPLPVTVADLEASMAGGNVTLHWSLARGVSNDLNGISVERAARLEGPYADRSGRPLVPSLRMSFQDETMPIPESGLWFYRLVLWGRDGSRTVVGPVAVRAAVPIRTVLHVPYATRSGDGISIPFALATPGAVRLDVFDVRGRLRRSIAAGTLPAGEHVRSWDRTDAFGVRLSRGVYLLRLEAGDARPTRKLVLEKP
jgi:hypothetical protein